MSWNIMTQYFRNEYEENFQIIRRNIIKMTLNYVLTDVTGRNDLIVALFL